MAANEPPYVEDSLESIDESLAGVAASQARQAESLENIEKSLKEIAQSASAMSMLAKQWLYGSPESQ